MSSKLFLTVTRIFMKLKVILTKDEKEIDVLCAGGVVFDHILRLNKFNKPIYHNVHPIEQFGDFFGGPAANVAVLVSRLGLKAGLVSAMGNDFRNSSYQKHLRKIGINLEGVVIIDGLASPHIWMVRNKHGGIVLVYKGSLDHISDFTLPFEVIDRAKMIYVDYIDFNSALAIVRYATRLHKTVVYNPGGALYTFDFKTRTLKEILDHVHVLISNEREVQTIIEVLGQSSISDLLSSNLISVVVTRGPLGSTIYKTDKTFDIPAYPPRKIVDVIGAGDGYSAGFIVALLKGFDVRSAGIIGSIVASSVIENIGAQTTEITWKEVQTKFRLFRDRSSS